MTALPLAAETLGLLDALTPNMVRRVRHGTEQGARVTIDGRALRRLLTALEAELPGVLDVYIAEHAAAARRRGEAASTSPR